MNNTSLDSTSRGSAGRVNTSRNPWLLFRPNASARLRLFCLPYAGGGAAVFRDWPTALPKEVEVCPVQLPGRENRTRERPFDRLHPLVEALVAGLEPMLQVPFAFFGHSMGALISFELTRELRRRRRGSPVHLFVSGHRAPQLPDLELPMHNLPEQELLKKIAELNGAAKEALENPDLVNYLLPQLRSDLAVCETYDYLSEAPLPCPITVFGGTEDSKIPPELLPGWRDQTTREYELRLYPGDHFFLNQAGSDILNTLAEDLRQILSRT